MRGCGCEIVESGCRYGVVVFDGDPFEYTSHVRAGSSTGTVSEECR
jgi:hypothetical protein